MRLPLTLARSPGACLLHSWAFSGKCYVRCVAHTHTRAQLDDRMKWFAAKQWYLGNFASLVPLEKPVVLRCEWNKCAAIVGDRIVAHTVRAYKWASVDANNAKQHEFAGFRIAKENLSCGAKQIQANVEKKAVRALIKRSGRKVTYEQNLILFSDW